MTGRSRSAHPGPGSATASSLPADYVAEHVDLGYAVTAHRAQGITTDTAHVLVEPTTTRENLYVAMTRGRESNHAYVVLDRPDDHATPHPGDNPDATARTVLYGVLQHSGAELSAHETITTEQDRWGSIAQLAAEYDTIAAAAQHDRWAGLITTSGLTTDQAQAVIDSDAFGALTAELRRAEANHHNVDTLLPRLIKARGFADADDIAGWYVDRFLALREGAFSNPSSFFNVFAELSDAEAVETALGYWNDINLPNLRENVEPTKHRATLVLGKAADHTVKSVLLRKL